MFSVGDTVLSKNYGKGTVTASGNLLVTVQFQYGSFSYYHDGDFVGEPSLDKIILIEKEKEQVKFNVGDKVRLKKEWYKEEDYQQMNRHDRQRIGKHHLFTMKVFDEGCAKYKENVHVYVDGGVICVPKVCLELVEEPKKEPKEYAKLCIDCNFMTTLLRDEPCSSCSNKSEWTPKAPKEPKAGDIIEHEGKKYRLVAKKARKDDLISVNYGSAKFEKGDIFKVTFIYTPTLYDGEWAEYGNGRHYGQFFEEHQYLVLEPLMHEWTKAEIDEANLIVGEIFCGFITNEDYIAIDAWDYKKDYTIKAKVNGKEVSVAKPISTDTPNKSIGMCVALCKATGREIPSFIKGDRK